MGDQQRDFDEGGVVEVLEGALGEGHVGQIEVVVVEVEVDAAEGVGQLGGQGGFAGAGTAGNGQDDGREGQAGSSARGRLLVD